MMWIKTVCLLHMLDYSSWSDGQIHHYEQHATNNNYY